MKFDINLILRSKGIQIYGLSLFLALRTKNTFYAFVATTCGHYHYHHPMLMLLLLLLLLLLPRLGRQQLHCHSRHSPTHHSCPQLYNTTPSVSRAGQDSNHIFFFVLTVYHKCQICFFEVIYAIS